MLAHFALIDVLWVNHGKSGLTVSNRIKLPPYDVLFGKKTHFDCLNT